MQHRPRTATKPAPRHAPLIAVATAAISVFAAAAIVGAASDTPAPTVDQQPLPAGTTVPVGPTPAATAPPVAPLTSPPASAVASVDEIGAPDAATAVASVATVATSSTTSSSAPAPGDASARTRANVPDADATVSNAVEIGSSADPLDDAEEPPLPGAIAGQVSAGDLAPAMIPFEPTLSDLEHVAVPELIDLLATSERGDAQADHEDGRGRKPPTAAVGGFEWGGGNPGQVAPGCLGGCVTSARIHAWPHTADVSFEITTGTAARFDVTVGTAGTLEKLHFSNGSYGMAWTTTLGPLVAGQEYAILVEVTDQSGHEETLTNWFVAPDPVAPAWDLSSNVTGCAAQCIQHGVVRTTDDPSAVVVEVGTTVPAWLTVWVSKDSPSTVNGVPTLPGSAIVAAPQLAGTEWEVDVHGLAPDTLHHVIVRAVGSEGGVAMRAGQFVTEQELPSLVEATFHWIRIERDGDEGVAGGTRGEIQLGWGAANGMAGIRSEEKLHAGDVIHLDDANVFPAHASSTNSFPPLVVVAVERDFSMTDFGQVIPYPAPASYAEHPFAVTVAWTFPMFLGDIAQLASCEEHADGDAWADDRCILLESAHPTGDHVEFEALISFRIVD